MENLEAILAEAVERYVASTTAWANRAEDDADEVARRRLLARSHGQRVLRRLRSELMSVHASFDRAAATAPDIYLAAPAHELWQSVGSVLSDQLRGNPEAGDVDRIRVALSALESQLGASFA